ncbi:RNA-directed DNA polymerase, eukaryota, reverse transcriptase zinc-binding domain protein [Tanacetum coccineum]
MIVLGNIWIIMQSFVLFFSSGPSMVERIEQGIQVVDPPIVVMDPAGLTLNPIASLIGIGKLNKRQRRSFPICTVKVNEPPIRRGEKESVSGVGVGQTLRVNELCGYVLWKPSRDFTRPLRTPSGLKGLLHTLNATVIPTKLYRKMVEIFEMVNVARRSRLGAWLRACWALYKSSGEWENYASSKFLKHKGVLSWFSSFKPWYDDFVVTEHLIWLEIEGVPLKVWHNDIFKKICSKWDEMLFSDDSDDCNRLTKRLRIKSSHEMLVFATIFVSVKGVAYAIRVRKLCSWTPTFMGEDSHSDDEESMELHEEKKEEQLDNNDAESVVGDDLEQVLNHLDAAHSPKNSVQKQDNGFNMEGSENTLASLIAANGDITGNSDFDFDSASARGKSGGIIYIWNSSIFKKSSIQCNENYVVVEGLWTPKDVRIMWIVVYAPHNLFSKIALWSSLANIIANWNGILVTMDDFNEVRTASERYGPIFNERNSELFNTFISNSSLFNIPLGGFNFTWMNKWGLKMSKLDWFLVSDNFFDVFPFATGVILEKEMDGFHNLVTDTWNNDGIIENNGLISFKKKLQNIKHVIREWAASKILKSHKLKKEHQSRLSDIDVKTDNSCASDEDFLNRRESIKILGDIDCREASDFAQKSRIKWALEGDENSSFFHGSHFRNRFLPSIGHSTSFNIELPNHLTTAQCDFLEHQCTREDIKKAVWDCGECQYKINGKILANRLSTVIGSCVSSEQTTFIKVDFEKAFDSVRWDFLELVMEKLGFGSKWHRSSVLVNGYPTFEFELFKGLRQGDPLSPLLFILVMEGLHDITCKLVDLGLFRGVSIDLDNLSISHLIKISGVSVPAKDAVEMAKIVGCGVAKFPLKYLGVPVGCNMTRCAYIIQKFSSKLAQWKAHLLSIGGRLSLIKSVLGIGSIYALNLGLLFKWIWRFRCHSIDLWVRVIKNLYGLNGGIHDDRVHPYSTWGAILSSVKRLKQNGTDLLALCIRKIGNGAHTSFWNDTWCGNSLLKTIYPRIYMIDSDRESTVSNRLNVRNWSSILRRLPRGGVETSQFRALLSSIKDVALSDQIDSWVWSLNASIGYIVASIRSLIDDNSLVVDSNATRWNHNIPIKINVFLWRVALNKLPTRVNLDRKGIDIESTLCRICCEDVETVNHIFFSCEMAKDLWALLARWWELDIPFCSNFLEWSSWLDSSHLPSKANIFLDGVGGTILWSIWNFQNRLVFSVPPPMKATLWDSIISQSFLWISIRNLNLNLVG